MTIRKSFSKLADSPSIYEVHSSCFYFDSHDMFSQEAATIFRKYKRNKRDVIRLDSVGPITQETIDSLSDEKTYFISSTFGNSLNLGNKRVFLVDEPFFPPLILRNKVKGVMVLDTGGYLLSYDPTSKAIVFQSELPNENGMYRVKGASKDYSTPEKFLRVSELSETVGL